MSEDFTAQDNTSTRQTAPAYSGPGPHAMNMGYDQNNYGPYFSEPFPQGNVGANFSQGNYRGNYPNIPPGNYGIGYQQYAGKGGPENYNDRARYGNPYWSSHRDYKNHNNYEDDDYYQGYGPHGYGPYRGFGYHRGYGPYDYGPYRGFGYHRGYGSYGYGPYSGYGCPAPGVVHHDIDDHCHYYGQPYSGGYGQMNQGRFGVLRNWLTYNPISNWSRTPGGNNFLKGIGIATAGIILAPAIIRTIRPLAVQAVHGAMSIVGEVKSVVADAREELEDIFADAKWENSDNHGEKLQEG